MREMHLNLKSVSMLGASPESKAMEAARRAHCLAALGSLIPSSQAVSSLYCGKLEKERRAYGYVLHICMGRSSLRSGVCMLTLLLRDVRRVHSWILR